MSELEELCRIAEQKQREADEAALAVVQKRQEERCPGPDGKAGE